MFADIPRQEPAVEAMHYQAAARLKSGRDRFSAAVRHPSAIANFPPSSRIESIDFP